MMQRRPSQILLKTMRKSPQSEWLLKRSFVTHEVFNQSSPFENVNFLASEKTVKESIEKMIQSTKNQDKVQIPFFNRVTCLMR